MRSKQQMMKLLIDFAKQEERIRLVTLEGSRTNRNIPADHFQDFDISYFVTDLAHYKANDRWLDIFGKQIMMQKPEGMELFPPTPGNWFSYLMLLEDGHKIDLTLIPLDETEDYFAKSDGLVQILLDKDARIKREIIPTDRQYWVKKPTAAEFDDCCNEFWFVSTYVAKGLARKEILFAVDHLHEHVRPNLLGMMAWEIGAVHGYTFSVGKNYKFLDRYLPREDWSMLLSTYAMQGCKEVWRSLFKCHALFRQYAESVAQRYDYPYPHYDEAVTKYIENIYAKWS